MNLKTVLQTVFLKGNAMKIKLGLFREKITYLLFWLPVLRINVYV